MLTNDICRCHDSGCPERESCLRFIERLNAGERTPHAASMFPFDIPLGEKCPNKIEQY